MIVFLSVFMLFFFGFQEMFTRFVAVFSGFFRDLRRVTLGHRFHSRKASLDSHLRSPFWVVYPCQAPAKGSDIWRGFLILQPGCHKAGILPLCEVHRGAFPTRDSADVWIATWRNDASMGQHGTALFGWRRSQALNVLQDGFPA